MPVTHEAVGNVDPLELGTEPLIVDGNVGMSCNPENRFRQMLGQLGNSILDLAATLGAYHLTYDPYIRFSVHLGGLIAGMPRVVIERNFNNVVRFIFNHGVFGTRGEDFLQRTGRTKWDARGKEEAPLPLRQALTCLITPASEGLRSVEMELLGSGEEPELGAKALLTLQGTGLPMTVYQEHADRAAALARVAAEVLDSKRRAAIGGEKHRAAIAKQLGLAIEQHSPYSVEPLPFLEGELRILLQALNWLGTMEGSYVVLGPAAQAARRIVDYYLESRIRDREQTEARIRPAEITAQEALLAAKTLVAISRRPMPDAALPAYQQLKEIEKQFGDRMAGLDDCRGEKLITDPDISRVFRILKLSEDFKHLPMDVWETIGASHAYGEGTPPLEFEFDHGLVVTVVLPPARRYLETQLDDVACWAALRFPLSQRLVIAQGQNGDRRELFAEQTSVFYDNRLLGGRPYDYKPETRAAVEDVRARVKAAFGGFDQEIARKSLKEFSQGSRWGYSPAELAPYYNDFAHRLRDSLLIKLTMFFPQEMIEKGLALGFGATDIRTAERQIRESGQDNLLPLLEDKYFQAILALVVMERVILDAPPDDGHESTIRINDLLGRHIATYYEVLWDPELYAYHTSLFSISAILTNV